MIVMSLITICGSVATIRITLWNSRKMLSQQNTHGLTVLNEQKRRETKIWRGQRLWDQKRDTYIDLLKCLHTLEFDSEGLKAMALYANRTLPDDIEIKFENTRKKQLDSFEAAMHTFLTLSAISRLILSDEAAESTNRLRIALLDDDDEESLVGTYNAYTRIINETRAQLIAAAKADLSLSAGTLE